MAKLQKTRRVASNTIFANKEMDLTSHFDLFLQNLILTTSADGLPSRLLFYVTKNRNSNLTNDNKIISLTIPIIPVAYNTKSARSLSNFVTNADSCETIARLHQETNPEIIRKREVAYYNSIMAYLKGHLAFAYMSAEQNHDKNAMNIIKSLKFMQGFDFELASLILHYPSKIVENRSIDNKNNLYQLVFADGKTVNITKEQYKSINSYARLFISYEKAFNKFSKLSKVLDDYETYDPTKTEQASVVANNSIRTNKPVKKVGSQENNKDSNKKTKPQQGEE